MTFVTSLVVAFAGLAAGFPGLGAPRGPHQLGKRQYNIGSPPPNDPNSPNGYIAPVPGDVRSPCPALNTLANHGFLPHDGKNLTRTQIQQAFVDGFNVGFSVTEVPKENFFNVCQFITGSYCYVTDLNILNTPHTFEHDHSLSRQDYMEGYQDGPADNHEFNATIFQLTLDVLQGSSHMTFQQANEVRLARESEASVADRPGWFTLAQDTQETELGFIFSIMKDFNLPDYLTNPLTRVDWWDFWFTYESFPTPLGWRPPVVQVEQTFIASVSSAIRSDQVITSTPTPFASSFLKERQVATAAGSPVGSASANLLTPVAAPGAPATAAPAQISAAQSAAGTRITLPNPYATSLEPSGWSSVASSVQSNVAAVQTALAASPVAGGPVGSPRPIGGPIGTPVGQ